MPDQQLIDPLHRKVTLHDSVWHGHIIKGHPEVGSLRIKVEQAITDPEQIQISASDPDCRVYYGMPTATGRRIAVVANVVTGMVKTAYVTKKPRKGVIEWSR